MHGIALMYVLMGVLFAIHIHSNFQVKIRLHNNNKKWLWLKGFYLIKHYKTGNQMYRLKNEGHTCFVGVTTATNE